MKLVARSLFVCICACGVMGFAQNPNRLYQTKDLKNVKITANGRSINVWVMDTGSKRQEGMMFLKSLEVPPLQGMLFVFPSEQNLSFWMKNTLIPLDIAYINAKGKVVTVKQMRALDESPVPATAPAKYALEMKLGAMKGVGIKVGSFIKIPKSLKARN